MKSLKKCDTYKKEENDLLLEGGEERRRVDEERPVRQREPTLVHRVEQIAREPRLADGTRRQVHELVLVALDGREEVGHARLCPVFA